MAELGALGRCCTRLDPGGVRIGEAASSRGLGRLCLDVSGTGIRDAVSGSIWYRIKD